MSRIIPNGEICEHCFKEKAIIYTAGDFYCLSCIPNSYLELEEWNPDTTAIRLAEIIWGEARVIK